MTPFRLPSPLPLPAFAQRRIDDLARVLLPSTFDFTSPLGEQALVPPDSISWRVFKNPLTVFIGGIAAVILELAEPRVRAGVWEHSTFRREPLRRLQRTGLAAMITIYGPRRAAEQMIAGVVQRHDKVSGTTPHGEAYRANDPELLTWVQATAGFGFAEAYSRFAEVLTAEQRDKLLLEAAPAAGLYGAIDTPRSEAERRALFERMQGRLEPSPILFEFLSIMRETPALPLPGVQRMLIRAAVELVPAEWRAPLGLGEAGLRLHEHTAVRSLCALADRVVINSSPAVQSCRRLGLPAETLYRRTIRSAA